MLSINGRPIIHRSLSYLRDSGIRKVIIGVRAEDLRLPRFVRQSFSAELEIEFVLIAEDRGPGHSLALCLDRLPAAAACLIVLGDTLFRFPELSAAQHTLDFVLTSPVEDAARWCLVETDASAKITAIADKPAENLAHWPALIGVYHLQDSTLAKSALAAELAAGNPSIQLRHALAPYVKANRLHAFPTGEWFDCGHPDFLSLSKRRLLQSREFNTLTIDELRGTITKRSRHTEKFLAEINYYRLLPADLATFFPRLVDCNLRPDSASLTLEYYGYPTLSELWAFEETDAALWDFVFRQLARIQSCFSEYRLKLSSSATFEFYWRKTVERLKVFSSQSAEFAALVALPVLRLNGRDYEGWPRISDAVEKKLRAMCEDVTGQIVHGDLCFPNILFDPVDRLFKFIDPRGNFGETGIFGDARYDLAKLLHSMDGGYDFFIHDLFSLQKREDGYHLQQFFPECRGAALAAFAATFGKEYNLAEIRLIEGLLFISMCALHSDAPARQVAMFCTGIRLLNETLTQPNAGL